MKKYPILYKFLANMGLLLIIFSIWFTSIGIHELVHVYQAKEVYGFDEACIFIGKGINDRNILNTPLAGVRPITYRDSEKNTFYEEQWNSNSFELEVQAYFFQIAFLILVIILFYIWRGYDKDVYNKSETKRSVSK